MQQEHHLFQAHVQRGRPEDHQQCTRFHTAARCSSATQHRLIACCNTRSRKQEQHVPYKSSCLVASRRSLVLFADLSAAAVLGYVHHIHSIPHCLPFALASWCCHIGLSLDACCGTLLSCGRCCRSALLIACLAGCVSAGAARLAWPTIERCKHNKQQQHGQPHDAVHCELQSHRVVESRQGWLRCSDALHNRLQLLFNVCNLGLGCCNGVSDRQLVQSLLEAALHLKFSELLSCHLHNSPERCCRLLEPLPVGLDRGGHLSSILALLHLLPCVAGILEAAVHLARQPGRQIGVLRSLQLCQPGSMLGQLGLNLQQSNQTHHAPAERHRRTVRDGKKTLGK
ncbi:hypothetical protein COO60DRAFT_1499762 [Scenedesmus sp. NREL 46B-D3]|nr:hypothetical protein COO60DRAFT_1499762 [Scenedesmus sp. NREL 46B-D3]